MIENYKTGETINIYLLIEIQKALFLLIKYDVILNSKYLINKQKNGSNHLRFINFELWNSILNCNFVCSYEVE